MDDAAARHNDPGAGPSREHPTMTVAWNRRWAVGILALGLWGARAGAEEPAPPLQPLLRGERETEVAPHGEGNVYAPEVMKDGNRLRMWYGGQGRDGHDRIHLAESADGVTWERKGVVLDRGTANHVNDPSVVKVGGRYYLYYTRAESGVVDEIALATSKDGVAWEPQGVVLKPGAAGAWDALLVGRPSVLYVGGRFHMWYDGRKDLPPGPLAAGVPQSAASTRSVGYASSPDGVRWIKHSAGPVLGGDAGGVDVRSIGRGFAMVYESHAGTRAAVSPDGVSWTDRGLLLPRSGGELDRFGHVTPMLVPEPNGTATVYLGAARAGSWDRNAIARARVTPAQLRAMGPP